MRDGIEVRVHTLAITKDALQWEMFSLETVYSHDAGEGKLPPHNQSACEPTYSLDVHMSRIFAGGCNIQGTVGMS